MSDAARERLSHRAASRPAAATAADSFNGDASAGAPSSSTKRSVSRSRSPSRSPPQPRQRSQQSMRPAMSRGTSLRASHHAAKAAAAAAPTPPPSADAGDARDVAGATDTVPAAGRHLSPTQAPVQSAAPPWHNTAVEIDSYEAMVEDMLGLRAAFRAADDTGFVATRHVLHVLRDVGIAVRADEAADVAKVIDYEGSGVFALEDLIAFVAARVKFVNAAVQRISSPSSAVAPDPGAAAAQPAPVTPKSATSVRRSSPGAVSGDRNRRSPSPSGSAREGSGRRTAPMSPSRPRPRSEAAAGDDTVTPARSPRATLAAAEAEAAEALAFDAAGPQIPSLLPGEAPRVDEDELRILIDGSAPGGVTDEVFREMLTDLDAAADGSVSLSTLVDRLGAW